MNDQSVACTLIITESFCEQFTPNCIPGKLNSTFTFIFRHWRTNEGTLLSRHSCMLSAERILFHFLLKACCGAVQVRLSPFFCVDQAKETSLSACLLHAMYVLHCSTFAVWVYRTCILVCFSVRQFVTPSYSTVVIFETGSTASLSLCHSDSAFVSVCLSVFLSLSVCLSVCQSLSVSFSPPNLSVSSDWVTVLFSTIQFCTYIHTLVYLCASDSIQICFLPCLQIL